MLTQPTRLVRILSAVFLFPASVLVSACASSPTIQASAPETETEGLGEGGGSVSAAVVFSHASYDKVLAEYVDDFGMVDYKRLLENRAALDSYLEQLAGTSPVNEPGLFPTKEHAVAYWVNAYNALMMRAVLDHYPVDSVTDIKVAHGVFSRIDFPLGGKRMTLDDIEKGTLLKKFPDPRIHWALTCASLSCPRIDKQAFAASDLSERLDREARAFLQSERAVVFVPGENVVRVSKYFDWYGKDFGGDPIEYIKPYLSEAQSAELAKISNPTVSFMDYDWRLNDQNKSWAAKQ